MPVCSYLIDILCTYEPVSVSALSNKISTCVYIYIKYTYIICTCMDETLGLEHIFLAGRSPGRCLL